MARIYDIIAPDWKSRLAQDWFILFRFSRRYGTAILALVASALIGWAIANSVSDYTRGGWEIHFIERGIGLNLHFHHWYYGIPLSILAFLLIHWRSTVSIFIFGLGQTLAAHSFINERGIPSIIEGGATWRVPPEIYFPIVTAVSLLYAFFLIRREEWLYRAKEREEISESYLCPKARMDEVLRCLNDWACRYLKHKKVHIDKDNNIEYGHWHTLERGATSEWQLDYVVSPFDNQLNLLVVRLQHVPLEGRAGELDERIAEMDASLKPLAQPAVGGPDAALRAFSEASPGTAG